MISNIKDLILGMEDINKIFDIIKTELDNNKKPEDVIAIINDTLDLVGKKYETGELFLSDLIMMGYYSKEIIEYIEKYYPKEYSKEKIGKILIGTVKGDIHDIGKNIVKMMLQSSGFEVIDLGIDVPVEKFVDAVINEKPDVLGLSALLTSTMEETKVVVEALKKKGIRNEVLVVLGGRPITREFSDKVGADGYARDAVQGVNVIKNLLGIVE